MGNLQKKLNSQYTGLQGSYWMLYCMVLSFASVFLLARGYSNSEIGVILAVSNILALILQPITASIVDRSKRISVLSILWSMSVLTVMSLLIVRFVSARCALLSLSYALVFAFVIVIQPFMTTLSFFAEKWDVHINFGACRALGSLAYAILAALMGTAVEKLGINAIPDTAIIMSFLFMLFLLPFSLMNHKSSSVSELDNYQKEPSSSIIKFINTNKYFSLFLLGVALLFATHSLHNNFIILVVQNVGGNPSDMGRICGYMAFLEVPIMLFFDRLLSKYCCSSLLKFSVIMFLAKAIAVFLAPSIPWLYAAFTFQAFSFAVYTPAAVQYAMLVVDSKDAVKAQAFVTLAGTLGSIFASLFGGILFDVMGTSTTLLVGVLVTALGTAISFFSIILADKGRRL